MESPWNEDQSARRDADARLAAALLAGEPGAAEQAWTLLSPLVGRVLFRQLGDGPDHQDLCQEVFLRFFARIAELRDRRALRAFLIGICLGVAQNERRRLRVRRRIEIAPLDDQPEHPIAPCDMEARQAIRRFCNLLASIDPEDRKLFAIRHVEKLALPKIAASRGWTLKKTKWRMSRLNQRIGRQLRTDPAIAPYARAFQA